MKIRSDFVTNSSSSSFIIELGIVGKNKKSVECHLPDCSSYSDDDYYEDYEEIVKENFKFNLEEIICGESISKKDWLIVEDDTEKLRRILSEIHVCDEVTLKKYRGISAYYKEQYLGSITGIDDEQMWWEKYQEGNYKIMVSYIDRSDKKTNYKVIHLRLYKENDNLDINELIKKFKDKSLEELCDVLLENTSKEVYDEKKYKTKLKRTKEKFKKSVLNKIENKDNIESIYMNREYIASGEFAELLADSDLKLCELARKVNFAKNSDECEKAIEEMKSYIESTNLKKLVERIDSEFGKKSKNIKYELNTDIKVLSKRLCSNCGPNLVRGNEHYELNYETNELTDKAIFLLE